MIMSKNLIKDLQNNPSKVGLGLKIKDLVNIIYEYFSIIRDCQIF